MIAIAFPTVDWASSGCIQDGVATLRCIPVVLQNIINFLLFFAGIVAVFLIVFSGIRFVTSSGDPQKIESARKTFFYAIIGLVVIALSFVVIVFISSFTGVRQLYR